MKTSIFVSAILVALAVILLAWKNFSSAKVTDAFPPGLYPVPVKGKWGFMDGRGKMVIHPQFDHADDFHMGIAAVSKKTEDGGLEKYGFIDTTGKQVVDFKFENVSSFQNQLCRVMIGNKYGFTDMAGKLVVPCIYDDASSFSEGLACVRINGKNGFVDTKGNMVIEPAFDRACWVSDFSEGLAAVYNADGTAGYIDRTGNYKIGPAFSYVSAFSEGLALVKKTGDDKYGYIDAKGNMVIAPQYDLSLPFREGVATVKIVKPDGRIVYRIIDKQGNAKSADLHYLFTGIFSEGLAGVENESHQWGFIDQQGRLVIEAKYAGVSLFKNGLSRMQTGSLFGGLKTVYINQQGTVIWKQSN
ncbi:MAG: WG repeat-containing protein [Gemmatimonadaceae bacterium]|nr:WG repeat-containing protein [Chitinophagaceae bacterium]